jgi:hypothetical protein
MILSRLRKPQKSAEGQPRRASGNELHGIFRSTREASLRVKLFVGLAPMHNRATDGYKSTAESVI